MSKVAELEAQIREAAQRYYTDGTSPLSDAEFDALVDELRRISPDSDLLTIGWGYNIYEDTTPGEKVKHKYGTAGSLDKCHDWNELGTILQSNRVDVSLKLDGMSVVLYYDRGFMKRALTRGDGEIGIDITDKVRRIMDYTVQDDHFTGAVRGEIIMSYEQFGKYKQIHPEAKNPRNTTVGLVNSKEMTDELKYLDIVVYTIVGDTFTAVGDEDWIVFNRDEIKSIWSMSTIRERLVKMFGKEHVVPHVSDIQLSEISFLDTMTCYRNMWYGKYPADGLVISQEYGTTKHHNNEVTYTARAFKFPAEQGESEVIEVEWNMSKTHYAIPKIHIQPLYLSGTNVEYCAGNNAQYIKENNIGPGTILKVSKHGEIIPGVDEIVKSTEAQLIDRCPECGEPLSWNGVHLECTNPVCGNAILQDTLIWINKLTPTDGLGDILITKMLNDMVASGMLLDITIESIMKSDLHLSETTQSAQQNIFASMWNRLHFESFSFVDALLALNIPRLGDVTAKKVANASDLIYNIIYDPDISRQYILADKIGTANAVSIINNIDKLKRLDLIWDRLTFDVAESTEVKGKVAITGKLSVKRSDFEKELETAGYKVGEISKDTNFLITDNLDSSSSKNKKADAWGIKKITESDFRNEYM